MTSGLAVAGTVVGGLLLATWMADFFAGRATKTPVPLADGSSLPVPPTPTGASAVDRLAGSNGFAGGGLSWRIDAWEAGLRAWIERPITGWGVGNFRQAIQGLVGAGFEQEAPRFDAHNVFVELLTTLGLPGLLVFGAFAVACLRWARGPLALAAVTLAWSWLLQPAGLSTLPLAMLLLGMAHTVQAPSTAPPTSAKWPIHGAAALGLLFAGAFFLADVRLAAAVRDVDAEAVESAAAFFPTDPTVADLVAQGWGVHAEATAGPERAEAIRSAIEWAERAVSRQSDTPRWLDNLALRQAWSGDYEQAVETLGQALELQPNRSESRDLLMQIAELCR